MWGSCRKVQKEPSDIRAATERTNFRTGKLAYLRYSMENMLPHLSAQAKLELLRPRKSTAAAGQELSTIDLFCGAGGITEGFRQSGYRCLYGNDAMPEAMETFSANRQRAE